MTVTSVEIENYRCFKKLKVDGLTTVNLFVGKNNSGKTSLLEAIEGVVSPPSAYRLVRGALERGEFKTTNDGTCLIDVRRWFHGHNPSSRIAIQVFVSGRLLRVLERQLQRSNSSHFNNTFYVSSEPAGKDGLLPALMLDAQGRLPISPEVVSEWILKAIPSVRFVTTSRPEHARLAKSWERVQLARKDEAVIQALNLIEPRIERLVFTEDGAQVLFSGEEEPVPLSSLGEGSSRLLQLILSLVMSKEGFLLIDEVELGLHYSVQPDVWRVLLTTAQQLRVQLFVTTHSKDCLEALSKLTETAGLTDEVSVHRIEAGATETVRMTVKTATRAMEAGVDVR
jgi:energy-coupling factor transporter ATP-binding protein EcfA2